MKKLLENAAFVFSVAIVLGLVYPEQASVMQNLIIPALILAMVLSMRPITLKPRDLRTYASPILNTLFANYLLLSGLVLILSFLLIQDPNQLKGFIIMAAAPPAVAIVPFTYLLCGDSKIAILGSAFCYLCSLFLAPLIILAFLGVAVDPAYLEWILILLVLFPLIVSRPLARLNWRVFDYSKAITLLSLALVTYSVIGLNQKVLVLDPISLSPIFLILLVRTFVTGSLVLLLLRKAKVNPVSSITYSLFSSFKNAGATAAIAIALLGPEAALPAGVSSIFELSFFVVLKRLVKKTCPI
ncbi:MAG: hypothetical protein JXB14_01900 [Candidatus Altiarchaeota archaeon]|nr:hypothetical protein [Candidatus Altiarchaeota archaeon]